MSVMFYRVIFQALFDSLSTFLIYNYLINKNTNKNNKNLLWILLTTVIYTVARIDSTPVYGISQSKIFFTYANYDLFPVNSIIGVLFLVLGFMILNSYLFKSSNIETFYLTLVSIVIFISVRLIIISIFSYIGLTNTSAYEYGYRILMLFILYFTLIFLKLPIYKFREYLISSQYIFKIVVINSFIFLISLVSFYNFNTAVLLENIIFVLIFLLIILFINFITLIIQREKLIQKRRLDTIENYVPVIDDLIDEVRSKQHEFDNKILAIYSVLETSQNLDEAKNKIGSYSDSIKIDYEIKKIMVIDNKVIAGFIYSKLKLAKLRNITLDVNIGTKLDKLPIEEYELIEILGILIDNSIEASVFNDVIYLDINKNNDSLEVLLRNPYKHTSNLEFSKMFELGYSTKSKKSRGYGLYNVKNIVQSNKGNILFSNSTINNNNYITIGVSLPYYY